MTGEEQTESILMKELEGAEKTNKKKSSTTWKRRAKGCLSLNKSRRQKKN
jgi:hypothetical protein